MPDDDTPHSIWLVPADHDAQALARVIDALAAAQSAPSFDPHLTVLGDLSGSPKRTHEVCRALVEGLGLIEADVAGIKTSPAFFMSLFLDLSLGVDLNDVRSALSTQLRGAAAPEFRPHVSLAYGLSEGARAGSSPEEFIGKTIAFKRIAVVRSAKSIPIEDWSFLSEIAL